MSYRVLFESALPDGPTRELVRVLESLSLQVLRANGPDGEEASRCPGVPVVTLCDCPARLSSPDVLGPRGWVAILPAGKGSTLRFLEAGAFAAHHLPIERGRLLSTIARCLCAAGAHLPTAREHVQQVRPPARYHASLW